MNESKAPSRWIIGGFIFSLVAACGGFEQTPGGATGGTGTTPGASGTGTIPGASGTGTIPGASGSGTGGTGVDPGTGGTGPGSAGTGVQGGAPSGGSVGMGGAPTIPDPPPKGDPLIDGPFGTPYEYRVHHPFRLTLDGPDTSDAANPSPFADYRLVVNIKGPSGKTWAVPGYYAADGQMGSKGKKWRIHFNPPEVGMYTYSVSFRTGPGIAISTDAAAGTTASPDGTMGSFSVANTNKTAPDFRATGKLAYLRPDNKWNGVSSHYFHTIGDGKVWLKTGSNSPENMFGYVDFANTTDGPAGIAKDFLHTFAPHVPDWKEGDPTWSGGKGKGIIGLVNYYASVGVNQMGFIWQNIGGDGDDSIPWLSRTDRTHFDNMKMQQWEVFLSHAETKGIALQCFFSEAENFNQVGDNTNGKIFYHEYVARFAHHGGLMWNIGEENRYTTEQRLAIAAFVVSIDPYKNPIASHTSPLAATSHYAPLLGTPDYTNTSIQDGPDKYAGQAVEFRTKSAATGHPWVVMADEQNPAGTGVSTCNKPGDADCFKIRQLNIWNFFLAGGGGTEYYMGYQGGCTDVKCEDLRANELLFKYTKYAREFLSPLPLDEMQPDNTLVSGGGKVFAKKGSVYAVYLPMGGTQQLNLTGATGTFRSRFFNVLDGTFGQETMLTGGGMVSLGAPPFPGDVAVLVQKM